MSEATHQEREWLKASHSKYKHIYQGNKAICGSKARPLPYWHWGHTLYSPRCPKCLRLEREGESG